MKNNIQSYLPALALAAVIAVSATVLRPAQGDNPRQIRHDVVIIESEENFNQYTNSEGSVSYQYGGYRIVNYDRSQNAPELPLPVADYLVPSTNLTAATIAWLYDQGFELTAASSPGYGTATLIRKR
jgi:hypothetical protein